MENLQTIDREVLASLRDALRWLDSVATIGGETTLINMMPNGCRSRQQMREALSVGEEEQSYREEDARQ